MANLLLSVLVVVILLGGPITLFAVIKILNTVWGGLSLKFIKTAENPINLVVSWDEESFEVKVTRVKLEFAELVPGGRSLSHSFTFEDSSAKKRTFAIPLKFNEKDMAMLTDSGLAGNPRAVFRSSATVEVETLDGETRRFKISKSKIVKSLQAVQVLDKKIDLIDDMVPDTWSVQTRVFPWKKVVEEVAEDKGHKKAAVGGPAAPRAPVDFTVTKVWIEPGCIVCDACEAEAPAVFWVQADTCIVRENAPLDDPAAIKAAAEGCPVDVIKYTKVKVAV